MVLQRAGSMKVRKILIIFNSDADLLFTELMLQSARITDSFVISEVA
jgi:hypothetical protein